MTQKIKNSAAAAGIVAALAVLATGAQAGGKPIQLPQVPTPPPVVLPIPTPNGGVIVGGQFNGTGGVVIHQPHGGGYTTNGFQLSTPGGTNVGASVTTSPSGQPLGGSVTFGGRF